MDNKQPTKSELYLRQTINTILLSGIIILFTGAYYCIVKAGVPYRDPQLELQIQYAVNVIFIFLFFISVKPVFCNILKVII